MNAFVSPQALAPDAASLMRHLQDLRSSVAPAPEQAARVAWALRHLCRAQRALLVRAQADGAWQVLASDAAEIGAANRTEFDATAPDRAEPGSTEPNNAASNPAHTPAFTLDLAWQHSLATLAERLQPSGFAVCPAVNAGGHSVLRVALAMVRAVPVLAVLELAQHERAALGELLLRAQLVADLPLGLEPPAPAGPSAVGLRDRGQTRAAPAVDVDVDVLAPATSPATSSATSPATSPATSSTPSALAQARVGDRSMAELVALALDQADFDTAALTLVNGLAATGPGLQVALVWADSEALQLVGLSHLEKFDRRSPLVELMEDTAQEALMAPDWLCSPGDRGDLREGGDGGDAAASPGDWPAVARLRKAQALGALQALAVRRHAGGPALVVLVMAAQGQAALAAPLRAALQGALAVALPSLHAQRQRQRGWLARSGQALDAGLRAALGPRHAWLKLAALSAAVFAVYAALATWNYRVHGEAQVVTDSTRLSAAPFDGRIDTVLVSSGDSVKAGAVLATLDTRDLQQQLLETQAEQSRFAAELDKARAAGAWGDQEIASTRQQQAVARQSRLLSLLEQAQQRAPFDAVVVEGERKDLLGAPVKKGDKLFRLAQIEGLYVQANVAERDIAAVAVGATGELALVTRPDDKVALRVVSVMPLAQVKGQEGNLFVLRAELAQAPPPWWRPGMSGSVRIDAGERNVFWIMSHRVLDKLRLWLWW